MTDVLMRPRTESAKTLRRLVRLEVVDNDGFEAPPRPKTWGDCQGHEGPCPWVGRSMNLYLDVGDDGSIRYNFPDLEPHEVTYSCALVEAERVSGGGSAERHGLTLDDLALRMNLTRERVRQLEVAIKTKLARELAEAAIGREVLEDVVGAGHANIISRLRIARAGGEQ